MILVAAPSSARANYDTFLGFSPDGSFYATRLEPGGLAFALCPTRSAEPSASWPAGVPLPKPGERCVQLCEPGFCKEKLESERVRPWLNEAKASAMGARGDVWSVEQHENRATVSATVGGKKLVMLVGLINPAPAKISDVFWRGDDGAVAFYLDPTGGAEPTNRSVVVGVIPVTSGRAVASMALGRAQKAWLAGDFRTAAGELRRALKFDPSYTRARYGLAVALSLMHDNAGARAELEWLKKSRDPDAKVRLEEAQHEPLLAWVALDPAVRKLLGLPPWAQLSDKERLLESDGRWSWVDDECDRTLTLHFLPPPVVKIRRQEQCKNKPAVDKTFDGTWKDAKPITVDLPTFELWPAAGVVQPIACPDRNVPGACLTITADPLVVTPFQRGLALRPPKQK